MSMPRGNRGRSGIEGALLVAGVVVACLLVMWAAAIGPSATLRGDGGTDDSTTSSFEQNLREEQDEQPPAPDEEPWSSNAWVDAITMLAGGALLVGFILWAVGVTRERRREAQLRAVSDDGADGTFDLAARAAVVTDRVEAQLEALRGGTPRNAIVALWQELEQGVADTGLPRKPWETSAEFTQRFLAELQADSAAATRLSALYREARFSTHELTEEHRVAARSALDALHLSLRSGAR